MNKMRWLEYFKSIEKSYEAPEPGIVAEVIGLKESYIMFL